MPNRLACVVFTSALMFQVRPGEAAGDEWGAPEKEILDLAGTKGGM